jgi:hypothetical protein
LIEGADTVVAVERIAIQPEHGVLSEGIHDAVDVVSVCGTDVFLDESEARLYLILDQGCCGHQRISFAHPIRLTFFMSVAMPPATASSRTEL